jgi:ubiquinone/menaquinone biosynthesis C-methylase UbiE
MAELLSKTTERLIPENFGSKEEYLLYLRHLYAYKTAAEKILKNSFVLEVGSGEGYGTRMLSENFLNITGLDVDKNAIEHAQKKYGSENCVFKLYDGHRIPFEENTFDAVVSFQVIEHIRDDKNYISEIYRVLKSDGVFIVTTPNKTLRLKPGQKPWNKFHVREYYPGELETVLKSKFSDVKVSGIFGTEEVQKIENERVKRGLKLISLDPLNLRKLIPDRIRLKIYKILEEIYKGKRGLKDERDFLDRYSLENFFHSERNVNDSLDLLAVLKK